MTTLLHNWTIMRALRLIIGGSFLFMGIQEHDALQGIVGGFFLFQALANMGCCGSSACAAPSRFNAPARTMTDNAIYEEIK